MMSSVYDLNQVMNDVPFDRLGSKYDAHIYSTTKGAIRMQLLLEDLQEYTNLRSDTNLSILDIGAGGGQFSELCLRMGHQVLLCDTSELMLDRARSNLEKYRTQVRFLQVDFLSADYLPGEKFDVVLMHGSAEWMTSPEDGIRKACSLLKNGGYLSLMIFNRDRSTLKRGINGQLLDRLKTKPNRKLTPPEARTPLEIRHMLSKLSGELLLQSGIRIFHGFFRQFHVDSLTDDEWIAQERAFYRTPPFSSLGEHTHFVWRKFSRDR